MKSIDFRAIPGNTLGTVVDSGPLPGDGRTNFAVAGPGAFWNDFGQIADHRRDDRERACSSHAPGRPRATPARPRPGALRPRGRRLPAGALLLRGASCVRPPPGASVRGPTQARRAAGGLQHACARSGRFRRARVRAVRPRARALARHTHVSPTILSVLPAGSRPGVCARGRQPIACSLTHTLTVACVASYMPVTWALGRRADG